MFPFQFAQHILHACACVNSLIISMCQAVLAGPAGRATLGVLAFYVITLLLTSLSCHLQLNYSHHLAVSHLPILLRSLCLFMSLSQIVPPFPFFFFNFHYRFDSFSSFFLFLFLRGTILQLCSCFNLFLLNERWVKTLCCVTLMTILIGRACYSCE